MSVHSVLYLGIALEILRLNYTGDQGFAKLSALFLENYT